MTLYDIFTISLAQLTSSLAFKVTSATGNGSTDDTAAIQADLNALPVGGHLLFPPGVYRLTSTLVINKTGITVEGIGTGTQFLADGDYGHVFDVRPDLDPTTSGAFTDHRFLSFYINSRGNRTRGSAIHTKWTHAATFRDLRIGTLQYNGLSPVFFWDGITLENESAAVISNCHVNARHYGVYFSGHKVAASDYLGTNDWNGLITGNCNIWGDHAGQLRGSAGVHVAGGCGGVQIEQCGIAWYENGVHAAGQNRELFIGHAFAADDIFGHGILIDNQALNNLQVTGGWASGCGRAFGGDGIHIADGDWGLDVVITGGTFYANAGSGIYLGQQGNYTITGCHLYSNGASDIVLAGGPSVSLTIVGTSMTGFDNRTSLTPILRGNLGVADSG